jgi:hypothetical protein
LKEAHAEFVRQLEDFHEIEKTTFLKWVAVPRTGFAEGEEYLSDRGGFLWRYKPRRRLKARTWPKISNS